MRAKRVHTKAPHELEAGEYGKWEQDENWYCVPPETDLVANLARHKIEEHDDGTITVTPSILVSNKEQSWHGFITRGDWVVC